MNDTYLCIYSFLFIFIITIQNTVKGLYLSYIHIKIGKGQQSKTGAPVLLIEACTRAMSC
jgi:hypothetical protein